MLSQTQVAPQANEAKTVIELLKPLVLQGKIIVADAMFCKKDVCDNILDSGGDYFIVVKENQSTLLKEIELAFAETEGLSPPTNNVKWKLSVKRFRRWAKDIAASNVAF